MSVDWRNQLYFGDNLDILRKYVADESVDLVYLDPPFNSKADYNVLLEYWCVSMVGAQPNQKKGADKGIDGVMNFLDGPGGEYQKVLVSVKGGNNRQRENVATLKGDMAREKAKMGILIVLEEPTGPMRKEAADAGMWDSGWNASYPVIQILTVQQLLGGAEPKMPKHGLENFKVAQKAKKDDRLQSGLEL